MKIVDILERTVPISRYADRSLQPDVLDTSIVVVKTDVRIDGEPLVGYGFSSIGRFGQGGLIRDRFAPRLRAGAADIADPQTGLLDPFRAWSVMMAGEKPGGHGERSVAVGTLDMALWDACAKADGLPLYACLQRRLGLPVRRDPVPVYAGGGYYFPDDDIGRLRAEMQQFRGLGYTHAKIKVGARDLQEDVARIEAAADCLGGADRLAIDAIYAYDAESAPAAAAAYAPFGLWWFEDVCDPLDFETLSRLPARYAPPIAAGEALFSGADARNLFRYGGLRPGHDVLVFDVAHAYGIVEYLRILEIAETFGWPPTAFQPHGGHLFTLHVAAALGLGGAEVNPHNFQPFGGLTDIMDVHDGTALPPDLPGIGFEGRAALIDLFRAL